MEEDVPAQESQLKELAPALSILGLLVVFWGITAFWTPSPSTEALLSARRPKELANALKSIEEVDASAKKKIEALCHHSDFRVRSAAFAAVSKFKIALSKDALEPILTNKVMPSEAEPKSGMMIALQTRLKVEYLNELLIPLFNGQLQGDSAKLAFALLERDDLPFGDEVKALCLTMDGQVYGKDEEQRRLGILTRLLRGVDREELGSLAGLLDKKLPSALYESFLVQLRKRANDSERAQLLKFLKLSSPNATDALKEKAAIIVLEQGQRDTYKLVTELSDLRLLLRGIKSHKLALSGTQNLLNLATNSILNLGPKSRRSEIRLSCKLLAALVGEKDRIHESDKKKMREKLLALTTSLESEAWKQVALAMGEGFSTVCTRADRDAFLANEESRMRFLGIQLCELLPIAKDEKDDGLEKLVKISQSDTSERARLQAGLSLVRRADQRGVEALLGLLGSQVPVVQSHARANLGTLFPGQQIERLFPNRKIPKEKPLKLQTWDRDAFNVPHSTLMP